MILERWLNPFHLMAPVLLAERANLVAKCFRTYVKACHLLITSLIILFLIKISGMREVNSGLKRKKKQFFTGSDAIEWIVQKTQASQQVHIICSLFYY